MRERRSGEKKTNDDDNGDDLRTLLSNTCISNWNVILSEIVRDSLF